MKEYVLVVREQEDECKGPIDDDTAVKLFRAGFAAKCEACEGSGYSSWREENGKRPVCWYCNGTGYELTERGEAIRLLFTRDFVRRESEE